MHGRDPKFSSIGFTLRKEEDILPLANTIDDQSETETFDVELGKYLHWSGECGAEIWVHTNNSGGLWQLKPHFNGKSRIQVEIDSRLTTAQDSPLEGALGCQIKSTDGVSAGISLLAFDSPDFQLHSGLAMPTTATIQIAAFPDDIVSVFESQDQFDNYIASNPRFCSPFVPIGLVSQMPLYEGDKFPFNVVSLSGRILDSEIQKNTLTGETFRWALVDSMGSLFDIVVAPELMEKEPQIGDVLYGNFYLSGKVTSD